MIKNGTRLQSQVCDTQVIVVRSSDSLDDLRAGGVPMVPHRWREGGGRRPLTPPSGGQCDGQALRRRAGAEVLVTKAGAGTLSVGTTALTLKEAKPLPASD